MAPRGEGTDRVAKSYEARFVRLYPMYWCAHLLLLLMPFTWLEPIDSRFLVSLTGLRWINLETTFLYGNAAWWYFAMLIQLYAIFPVLFVGMRKLGLVRFGIAAAAIGFGMRYMLLVEWKANGLWLLGANALSRLPEFAIGMILVPSTANLYGCDLADLCDVTA